MPRVVRAAVVVVVVGFPVLEIEVPCTICITLRTAQVVTLGFLNKSWGSPISFLICRQKVLILEKKNLFYF